MKPLPAVLFTLALLLLPALVSAQCTVPGDQSPCDGNVTMIELTDYINLWYTCSSCYPDLFEAIEAYYGISCVSDCTGRVCGPDPVCGRSCGACSAGYVCNAAGQCEASAGNVYYVDEDSSVNITLVSNLSGSNFDYSFYNTQYEPVYGDVENITSFDDVATADVTYYPEKDYFGEDHFKYSGSNGSDSKIMQIWVTVNPMPDAPVFSLQNNLVFGVSQGESVIKNYKIADDVDGDTFTYTTAGLPSFATLTPDGYLRVDIDDGDIGNYNDIEIKVSDGIFEISGLFNISIREAKTYYVDDSNGDDNNDGLTSGTAWKTINRSYPYYTGAGNRVQQGDTVIIRNGSYGNFTESTDNGWQYRVYRSDWITYKADTGHIPLFERVEIENVHPSADVPHGDSYLIFDGFNITSGVYSQYTSYVQIKNSIIAQPALNYTGFYEPYVGYGDGVTIRDGHYITVEGNDIRDIDRGLQCKGVTDHVIIKNNYIYDIANDGFSCAANDILVEGNYITGINQYRTYAPIYGYKTKDFIVGEKITQVVPNGIAEAIVAEAGRVTSGGIDVIVVIQINNIEFEDTAHGGADVVGSDSGAILGTVNVDYAHNDGFQLHSTRLKNIMIINNTVVRDGGQGFKLGTYQGGALHNVTFAYNIIVTTVPCLIAGFHGVMHHNVFYGGECQLVNNVGANVLDNMYNNVFEELQIRPDGAQTFPDEYFVWIKNHSNNIFNLDPNGNGGPSHTFYTNPTEYIDYDIRSLFLDPDNLLFNPVAGSAACPGGNPLLSKGEYIGALPCNPLPPACVDADNDGYYTGAGCPIDKDCNDSDNSIYPGAMEICENGIDENCNGADTLCPPPGTPLDYIAWWRFDGDITDFGPNEAHGTWKPRGSPEFVTGVQGDAISLDGEKYIETPLIPIDFLNFTILAWVKTDNVGNSSTVVGFGLEAAGIPFINLGKYKDDTAAVSQVDTENQDAYVWREGPDINDGNWHHIIGIRYNHSNLRLFVDGNLYRSVGTAEGPANTLIDSRLETTSIGALVRDDTKSFFNGSIDEVMVYNRALNQTEIQQIYDSQK